MGHLLNLYQTEHLLNLYQTEHLLNLYQMYLISLFYIEKQL